MRGFLVAIVLGAVGFLISAPASAADRYYLKIAGVEKVPGVPAEVEGRVTALVGEVIKERKDFVAALDGAPAEPDKLGRWLKQRHINAFEVTVKITGWEREVTPATGGKSGQLLKIRLTMQLVGTSYPSDALAFSGSGASTVILEVGKQIFPKEESSAADAAIREATGRALDEAVARLRTAAKTKAKPKK